jgi:hypothetical protein
MSFDRKPIWKALEGRLREKLSATFVVISRKPRAPQDLGTDNQPALFIVQAGESTSQSLSGGKTVLHGMLLVYDYDRSADELPGQETELMADKLSDYAKAIEDALEPDQVSFKGRVQTLDGAVEHCWLQGDTLIDPGIFGKQASLMKPIELLVP